VNAPRELAPEAWSEYLDALTRELLNAPVAIEINELTGPPIVESESLALQALLYDRRDDVFEVAAACAAGEVPSILHHVVDHPLRVAVDNGTMLAPITISVDGDDGARTVIRVEPRPESVG
jgi:hypothetical protein